MRDSDATNAQAAAAPLAPATGGGIADIEPNRVNPMSHAVTANTGLRDMSLDTFVGDPADAAPLTSHGENCADLPVDEMFAQATAAASFLKALSHEGRLMILCHLSSGERSVTELETLLGSRQAAVSQQLARLRLEGLVSCRREGKAIYYSVSDPKVRRTIDLIYDLFCNGG